MLNRILFVVVMSHSSLLFGVSTTEASQEFFHAEDIVEYVDGYPVTSDGRVVVERNEANEMVTISLKEYLESKGSNFLNLVANYFDFKKTFQTVTSYITPVMEDRFELFVIVNVDYRKLAYGEDKIPSQHMRIVRRAFSGQNIFQRDGQGRVTGINPDTLGGSSAMGSSYDCLEGSERGMSESSGLMKISSGKGRAYSYTPKSIDAYLDTPAGIYRFNDSRNQLGYRGKNEKGQRVMYTPIYFDLNYPWGKSDKRPNGAESGLAIHGTGRGSYKYLGSQASHGCIRTHQQVSQCIKSQFHELGKNWVRDSAHGGPLKTSAIDSNTPYMDTRLRLKSEVYDDQGRLYVKAGTPALILIFYGYDESLETGEITEI